LSGREVYLWDGESYAELPSSSAVFCRAAQDQVGSCFPFQVVGAESLFKVLRGGRRISREEGFVKLGLPMRRDALLLSL